MILMGYIKMTSELLFQEAVMYDYIVRTSVNTKYDINDLYYQQMSFLPGRQVITVVRDDLLFGGTKARMFNKSRAFIELALLI